MLSFGELRGIFILPIKRTTRPPSKPKLRGKESHGGCKHSYRDKLIQSQIEIVLNMMEMKRRNNALESHKIRGYKHEIIITF